MEEKIYNKVVFGGKTLIDLTGDTISPDALEKDITAHDKTGAIIIGTSTKDSDTSDATLLVSEALQDKIFYANGRRCIGTAPNHGGVDEAIKTKEQEITIPVGYHDGSGTISISVTEQVKIIPGNIKQGVVLLGVEGEYSGDGANLQSKTVIPSFVEQTVLPDVGYDGMASVVIKAIPYTESENAAGGITVTIGG